MSNLSTDAVPALANGFRLQWEPAQNSHVLLYPEGMKVLSDSASEITSLCDGKRSIEDIITALLEKFPDADLRQDVIDFFQSAVDEGWMNV